MPFGLGKSKEPERIVVHRFTALTGSGVRKQFEKDANEMAKKGYRVASTVTMRRVVTPMAPRCQ